MRFLLVLEAFCADSGASGPVVDKLPERRRRSEVEKCGKNSQIDLDNYLSRCRRERPRLHALPFHDACNRIPADFLTSDRRRKRCGSGKLIAPEPIFQSAADVPN